MDSQERFWSKVDKSGECWEWTASTDGAGYGWIRVRGKLWRAHRLSWTWANGPIPEGMSVLHHCDNPGCVRPNHLFLGTQADNMNDMGRKGRRVVPSLSGEQHSQAKLTWVQVNDIRRRCAKGESFASLGREYGVDRKTVWMVARGKTWVS